MPDPDSTLQVLAPNKSLFESPSSTGHQNMLAAATTRQSEEVKGAIFMAKQFPRDQLAAYQRVLRACERPGLAREAMYAYPRGGQQVTGPSIRMAEVLAQNWGNIDFGIVELDQIPGKESIVMAYCWDLETNTRQTKVFTVPHVREKRGGNEILKDPRDIYELVANQGARRVRACILGIIPGDVVDDAVSKCAETMTKADQAEGPLAERIKKLALAFQKQGVTTAMMEMRLGKKSDAWTEFDYSMLKKIFLSIRDGFQKKEDFFSYDATQEGKPAPAAAEPRFDPPAAERKPRATQQKQPPAAAAPATPPPAEPETPAPGGEPDAPEEKPVPPADLPPAPPAQRPMDPSGDAIDMVSHLIKTTSGVDSAEVFRWLVENRVIPKAPSRIGELPREAMELLVEKWATVTADIRGD